ncbi:MAG: tRNA adenosine(34) deaminase TadA [Legionellales bacterium]|nr:tRNA adenosine(34) deaminase TadA [Legionellales bacterium]
MNNDEQFMRRALELAQLAKLAGEVPVGAVIVADNAIIAEAYNSPIALCDASAHAEILALRAAGTYQQNYRLKHTTLYVTLEPCAMCAAAMLHARIERCVFGAFDPKTGAVQSRAKIFDDYAWNHRIIYQGGILASACSEVLKQFFQERR